jgi:hypothetical protein
MNRYNKRASFGELPAPQGTSILDAHMDKIFISTSEQIISHYVLCARYIEILSFVDN